MCRFDRNEFGQFLGSATVTFERPEDAKRAVNEYNGAYLDDRVLTVEFDFIQQVTQVVKEARVAQPSNGNNPNIFSRTKSKGGRQGKTLRLNTNN